MEVHHHAHTARKKWTHYLWEFLMLFLAVFCGFLAENKREHMVEHQREKQYIRSHIEDLHTDTTKISTYLKDNHSILDGLDTLLQHFEEFASGHFSVVFIKYGWALNGYTDFSYTDRTIRQLKNAGGLRLIRNQAASDSIIDFDAVVQENIVEDEGLNRLFERTSNAYIELFNLHRFEQEYKKNGRNPELMAADKSLDLLLTHDKQKVWSLYHYLNTYKSTLNGRCLAALSLKEKAVRLIKFLKKEYHLK